MCWIKNEDFQNNLPTFGYINREKINRKLDIFLESENPICFIYGGYGTGKTTALNEYFILKKYNVFWLLYSQIGKKLAVEIPEKSNLVLIIDDFEYTKKGIKLLVNILKKLDLDNPQFKLMITSNKFDTIDYLELNHNEELEEVFNYYQDHKINFDLFPPEKEKLISQMKSKTKYSFEQLEAIIEISSYNFNEIIYLNYIFQNLIKEQTKISFEILYKILGDFWEEILEKTAPEYSNKKSKICNALYSLALFDKKKESELKPLLKKNLLDNHFIKIKGNTIQLTSNIVRSWILIEKFLATRDDELLKRDLNKVMYKNPIQYSKISFELIKGKKSNFDWLLADFINSELYSISFKDKVKAIISLIKNIMTLDQNQEKNVSLVADFFFTTLADIRVRFENYVTILSNLLVLSPIIDPKIVYIGMEEILIDCRKYNYSIKSIEEFVWIFTNYLSRSIPDLSNLVKLIETMREQGKISEKSKQKNLHVITLFMGYNEQYCEAFNILYDSIIKDNQNLNFRYYTSLITISGLLNHYKPKKEQIEFLNKRFNDVNLLKEKTKKILKIATAIEANIAIGYENYQERITKLEEIIDISEKNEYSEVLAASYDKIAQLLMQKGKTKEAQTYFEKALQLSLIHI